MNLKAVKPADKAWAGLATYVVAWNLLAPEGEMLSMGLDRYLESHPFLSRFITLGVSLHLLNLIPEKFDMIHLGFLMSAKTKERWRTREVHRGVLRLSGR